MTGQEHTLTPPDIPGYSYVRPLGSGGFSDVFLYEQHQPKMNVAVKVLTVESLTGETRAEFLAEANTMAQLADHPAIVQIFSADVTSDGRPYLVMKYYANDNMNKRAAAERFPVAEVLRIGIQISDAVETAHRAGILHLDIKPANILTGPFGIPALTDFGIAVTKGSENTSEGASSPPWAAPEVVFGTADADERSDVYSLAATVWHLLAGHSPFAVSGGDNGYWAVMQRVRSDPPPRTGRPDVPESLERLLQQAMAKEPARRPGSALAFARSLQAVEQEQRWPVTPMVVEQAGQRPAPRRDAGEDPGATRMRPQQVVAQRGPVAPASPGAAQSRSATAGPIDAFPGAAEAGASGSGAAVASPADDATRRGRRVLPGDGTQAEPAGGERMRQFGVPSRDAERTVTRAAAPGTAQPGTAQPGTGAADGAAPGIPGHSRRWLIASGIVVCVLAVVAGVLVMRPAARPATPNEKLPPVDGFVASTSTGALLQDAPGRATVTASRTDGSTVVYRWTYDGAQPGDSFRWRSTTTSDAGAAAHPSVSLQVSTGQQLCLQVQVLRSSGGQASDWSVPTCSK